ncbi:MAG: putative phosphothreonine lyase domain-containing protein [Phototrophicaceae bacterium]
MSKCDDQPNMDLINMVQRARMAHDKQARPSDVAAVYWIEARCQGENCQQPTPRAGQWVLDLDASQVDAAWAQIKAATEAGQLGYKSKVSTASRRQGDPNSRTLAVRTADADDSADVERVRQVLNTLGLPGEWRYERG